MMGNVSSGERMTRITFREKDRLLEVEWLSRSIRLPRREHTSRPIKSHYRNSGRIGSVPRLPRFLNLKQNEGVWSCLKYGSYLSEIIIDIGDIDRPYVM